MGNGEFKIVVAAYNKGWKFLKTFGLCVLLITATIKAA